MGSVEIFQIILITVIALKGRKNTWVSVLETRGVSTNHLQEKPARVSVLCHICNLLYYFVNFAHCPLSNSSHQCLLVTYLDRAKIKNIILRGLFLNQFRECLMLLGCLRIKSRLFSIHCFISITLLEHHLRIEGVWS
jgi:hypothetical protein